jgi:diguanylate cyclase (GGDEF)-like protein
MFEEANQVLSSPAATGTPAAAIMIDIDQFKRINDAHGHGVGDEVIQTVASRLASALRENDIICRYGGEEFAVLLPGTPVEGARRVAQRLHDAVSNQPIATSAGELTVTVSVGLAAPAQLDGQIEPLLNRADEALYDAKRSGRNRISTA